MARSVILRTPAVPVPAEAHCQADRGINPPPGHRVTQTCMCKKNMQLFQEIVK